MLGILFSGVSKILALQIFGTLAISVLTETSVPNFADEDLSIDLT